MHCLPHYKKNYKINSLTLKGGYVPISFAGAVCKRGKLTIKECYDRAVELEKTAADAWKYQVGSKNKLLTDKKIEELKNLKSKEQNGMLLFEQPDGQLIMGDSLQKRGQELDAV